MAHRSWDYFESRPCYPFTLFNLLIELHGLQPNQDGFVPLAIVDFDILQLAPLVHSEELVPPYYRHTKPRNLY